MSTEERKIRVCFLNLYPEIGGGEIAALKMAEQLDPTSFTPVFVFNKVGEFPQRAKRVGIETVYLEYPAVMLKKLINPFILWRCFKSVGTFYRFLRDRRIDIVSCSDVLLLLIIAFPAAVLRIPVVYNVIFFYEWSRLSVFNGFALFFVAKIVTNSYIVEGNLKQRTVGLGNKIVTIHPGIDPIEYKPLQGDERNVLRHELGVPHGTSIVGMVARFDPSKGQKIFLEAASIIAQRRANVKFIVAGGQLMSDVLSHLIRYHADVMDVYRRLQIGDRLVFLGERSDIAQVIRGLDVLVCPSVSEGFGLVLLEAAASGVPIVTSSTVGSLELLEKSNAVVVIGSRNVGSFISGIEQILDALDDYKKHARVNADGIRQYNWKQVASRYARTYDLIVPKRNLPNE